MATSLNLIDMPYPIAPLSNSQPNRQPKSIPPRLVRKRGIRSCKPCRSRKVKCNRQMPCQRCVASGKESQCTYNLLPPPSLQSHRTGIVNHQSIQPKEAAGLQPFVVNARTAAKRNDAESDEKHRELRAGVAAFNSDTQAYQFYGPSSHFSFVQRLYQRMKRQSLRPLMMETHRSIPEGLQHWGVDKQMFSKHSDAPRNQGDVSHANMLPRHVGDSFIAEYFAIVHPQAPILVEAEITMTWRALFDAPRRDPTDRHKIAIERSILYMVLAIGACLSNSNGDENLGNWSDFFSERSSNCGECFTDTSLGGTHLALLRAIYAMQVGRSNSIYLYLGQAARSAMALGLHISPNMGRSPYDANRLRVTFWTTYYLERITCMSLGRPTCILDEQINLPYPDEEEELEDEEEEEEEEEEEAEEGRAGESRGLGSGKSFSYAYLSAMAIIGQVSHTLMTGAYSPLAARTLFEVSTVERLNNECTTKLEQLCFSLPPYLQFFDSWCPTGEDWQEVQRTALGIAYHLTRLLIFRPSLVYVTFFKSLVDAQQSIGDRLDLKANIKLSICSAKALIDLTYAAFFSRCTRLKRDGNIGSSVVTACLTLLFDVLDPGTTTSHANEVFKYVDKALECLAHVENIGSKTGKAMSMDVMKVAKDALISTEMREPQLVSDLSHSFAWLNDTSFERQADQVNGSWLPNVLDIPNFNQLDFGHPTFDVGPNIGSTNSHDIVLDLMGEGLSFPDSSYGSGMI